MMFFKPPSDQLGFSTQLPYTEPIWNGPSDHAFGKTVAIDAVLATTDDLAILLPCAQSYRNGFILQVELRRRHRQDVPLKPLDPVFAWEHLTERPLRFGVEFADGRAAGDTTDPPFDVPRDEVGIPYIPFLFITRGLQTRHAMSLSVWVWPLPPDGPLVVRCEWLREGIRECSTELDGNELRLAGEESALLWSPQ
jgi:hypothetical protein